MKKVHLFIISYIYLTLPFLLFCFGWLKLIVAIPAAILALFSIFFIFKNQNDDKIFYTMVDVKKIVLILGVICIWVYFSGIGKYVYQNTDHNCRNAIFEVLVNYKWPVLNTNILANGNYAGSDTTTTSLIYYIGFWLPSAVIGKIFGIEMGYFFQYIWAVLGIFLMYMLYCIYKKKIVVWPLIIMIFFSGLDIIGIYLTNYNLFQFDPAFHMEGWSSSYQFSSMTTQLFWVFNQSIPAWLCTMLLLVQEDNRNVVFILACSMLPSTFPFVGILLIVLFMLVSRFRVICNTGEKDSKNNIKKCICNFLKETCTFQNVLGGGVIGIISFLYLKSNLSSGSTMNVNQENLSIMNNMGKWLVFVILELLVYAVAIYKYQKKNAMFYFIVISLLFIPLYRVGFSIDFCMRASIPGLFVLMIWVIDALEKSYIHGEKQCFIGLAVLLIIGSVTPVHEFTRTIQQTVYKTNVAEDVAQESVGETSILNSKNFAGAVDNNWFYKYLVR